MSTLDLALALLGVYLGTGLLLAAWRRAAGGHGDIGIWIALGGFWLLLALPRWTATTVTLALGATGIWLAGTFLLVQGGALLGRAFPLRGLAWILGPAQALSLLLSWGTAARRRRLHTASLRDEPARPEAVSSVDAPAEEAFESVVELGETTLEEVLVPRSEVRALPETASVSDWVRRVAETHRTHLPVHGGDLDEIRGYVCVKDIYRATSGDEPVTRFVREVRVVPESMRADDLLRELIGHNEKIAMVVDEFGGVAGLVRDHDLFEILLGEIDREQSAPQLRPAGDGVYVADGLLKLDDFNEAARAALPEGTYETLAGLFLARHGRIPAAGERLTVEGATLEVLEATERRITRLKVTLPPEDPPPSPKRTRR